MNLVLLICLLCSLLVSCHTTPVVQLTQPARGEAEKSDELRRVKRWGYGYPRWGYGYPRRRFGYGRGFGGGYPRFGGGYPRFGGGGFGGGYPGLGYGSSFGSSIGLTASLNLRGFSNGFLGLG